MLNLNNLKYIIEVANCGSISKASEQFYISQPHLSNTIRAVERELGIDLFKRSSKGMVLTQAGIQFVNRAQKLINELHALEADFTLSPQDSVKLSVSMSRSHYFLAYITECINEQADKLNLSFQINETNGFQVIEDVCNETADLGLLHFSGSQKNYFLQQIQSNGLKHAFFTHNDTYLMMSKKNPLANEPVIYKHMLRDQISVFYGDCDSFQAPYFYPEPSTDSDKPAFPKFVRVYDRCTAIDIITACPNAYSLLPHPYMNTLSQYNLVIKQCEDLAIEHYSCFVYKSEHKVPMPKDLFNKDFYFKRAIQFLNQDGNSNENHFMK